jgi:hypothetical protein
MPTAQRLFTRLKRLRHRDISQFLIAFLLLGIIRLGLWLLPFRLCFRWLMQVRNPFSGRHRPQLLETDTGTTLSCETGPTALMTLSPRDVKGIVWSVKTASRYMPGGAKCLARAIATQVLMNWQHYESELHIGVNKRPEGDLQAHAWIEYQGRVIIGNLKDLSNFTQLMTYRG